MIIQKTEELVKEASHLLTDSAGIWTDADRSALEDMVRRAERALAGEDVVFTRNREFLIPREHEAVKFAYDRFTMVPTFFEKNKVYSHYGLKEAVRWFKEQDMSQWSLERLYDRRKEVLERGQQLLAPVVYGNHIGEYDAACGERLQECLKILSACKEEHLAECLVQSINAFHNLCYSRKLYSEQETQPVFLLSSNRIKQLREKIRQKSIVQQEYEKIKAIAQEIPLEKSRMAYEQIWEKYSYEELNSQFHIWGDTGRVVNMTAPRGTKGARLSLRLPAEENEQQGLGHILISGVRIFSADGPEIVVPDSSFGEKSDTQPYICLCNPTMQDESVVTCKEILPLKENCGYTLFFKAKQEGKFKSGLRAVIEFMDEQGNITGEFVHVFNRKSAIYMPPKALSMQCNAIVYALEGDTECAQKAKYDMLTFLNDFCQGAEYWMVYNSRPEGCDAYGAVQAGRIMCSVASTFSMIRSANAFTEEELQFFYQIVEYLLQYCIDKRDRITMSRERAQQGSSNWQTDMCIGVVALMTVLPEFPDRKIWMYNAEAILEAQLAVNLNRDGSWPESIRYHHAALEHFAAFAAVWKQETGDDWLVTTRLKDMFAYTIHTVTPAYEYFDGCIGTPPFGDHRLSGGSEFSVYGLWVNEIAQVDKKLADQMYQIWAQAHYPVQGLSGEAIAVENLIYAEPGEYQIQPRNELQLESAVTYRDSGLYIFRYSNEMQKENYLAVMSSPKRIGHGHLDQGSFILYYHNYPIIMDSGIEGYFDASTQWHLSSYSHACLQFAATEEDQRNRKAEQGMINLDAGNYSLERGWLDVPYTSKVLEVSAGEKEERITLEIEHPRGRDKGVHFRTFIYNKVSGEVTIKDKIENYSGKVLFSLPMVMKATVLEGQVVHTRGYYQVNANVEFVSPAERIYLERGRTTPVFPNGDELPMLLYVRAVLDASHEAEVKIQPKVIK